MKKFIITISCIGILSVNLQGIDRQQILANSVKELTVESLTQEAHEKFKRYTLSVMQESRPNEIAKDGYVTVTTERITLTDPHAISEFWRNLMRGRTTITHTSDYDCEVTACVMQPVLKEEHNATLIWINPDGTEQQFKTTIPNEIFKKLIKR